MVRKFLKDLSIKTWLLKWDFHKYKQFFCISEIPFCLFAFVLLWYTLGGTEDLTPCSVFRCSS